MSSQSEAWAANSKLCIVAYFKFGASVSCKQSLMGMLASEIVENERLQMGHNDSNSHPVRIICTYLWVSCICLSKHCLIPASQHQLSRRPSRDRNCFFDTYRMTCRESFSIAVKCQTNQMQSMKCIEICFRLRRVMAAFWQNFRGVRSLAWRDTTSTQDLQQVRIVPCFLK